MGRHFWRMTIVMLALAAATLGGALVYLFMRGG